MKPVTGETLGEQPACKTSLFSSNCKCPQYDNQFSFVQLFGESYLSCSQFFWNFVLFRKSLALGECDCLQFLEEQRKEEKQAGRSVKAKVKREIARLRGPCLADWLRLFAACLHLQHTQPKPWPLDGLK